MFKRLASILPGLTRRNPDPEATNDLVEMEKERRRLYRRLRDASATGNRKRRDSIHAAENNRVESSFD